MESGEERITGGVDQGNREPREHGIKERKINGKADPWNKDQRKRESMEQGSMEEGINGKVNQWNRKSMVAGINGRSRESMKEGLKKKGYHGKRGRQIEVGLRERGRRINGINRRIIKGRWKQGERKSRDEGNMGRGEQEKKG